MRLRVVISGGICVLLPDWTTLSLASRASSRWRERMSGKENNMSDRNEIVSRVTAALEGKPAPVAIRNARKADACGERRGYWVVSDAAGVIVAAGTGEEAFEHYCRTVELDPADRNAVIDAEGRILTPGYVDIHAHGAWEKSFDDGSDGIDVARAGHAVHGTTRQVLSLITNPVDVICRNIRTVRAKMESGRPDILGCHLEGPFLALARKGAHDPECLKDPVPDIVDDMLEASGAANGKIGCIRQITIAPELPHGISAIRQFAAAGVVPAVGHCDADYETAKAGFDAGDERPAPLRARSDSGRGGGSSRHHRAHQRRISRAGSDGEPLLPVRASSYGLRNRCNGRDRLPGRCLQVGCTGRERGRRACALGLQQRHRRLHSAAGGRRAPCGVRTGL